MRETYDDIDQTSWPISPTKVALITRENILRETYDVSQAVERTLLKLKIEESS
jgi:hypothetical protein